MSERTHRALWMAAAIGALGVSPSASAKKLQTPELDAQRDVLLEKIIRGEDFERSVDAFKALVSKRDAIIPTSEKAQQEEHERFEAKRAWDEEWRNTADSEVAWRCGLSADPVHPQPAYPDWAGDWGRVTKKEQVRLEPKNALDEGELWTLYEVKGLKRTYRFRGAGFGIFRHRDFEAEKGDLVLVCDGGRDTEKRLPPQWQQDFQRTGFAVRIKSPPLIAQKKRWNPIHITDNRLFWAVKDVKWRYPPDAYVLSVISLGEDLGGGRWQVDVGQDLSIVVEVPKSLAHQDLLVPGHKVWAILGNARFDRSLRKLVLTAEDLEAHYIDEVPIGGDSR